MARLAAVCPRGSKRASDSRRAGGGLAREIERWIGREMDDEQFQQLLQRAERGETAAVLAAVDLDPALLTRANEIGSRLLH